jgi:hypothetical protein
MEQDQNDHPPAPPDPRSDARAAVLHLALARPALGDALIRGGVEHLSGVVARVLATRVGDAPIDLDASDPHAARVCVEQLSRRVVEAVPYDPELQRAVLGPGGGVLGALLDRLAPVPISLNPYPDQPDDHLTERVLVDAAVALGVDPEAAAEAAFSDPGWLGERCRAAVAELRSRADGPRRCPQLWVLARTAERVGAPLPAARPEDWTAADIATIVEAVISAARRSSAGDRERDAMLGLAYTTALREAAASAGVGTAQLEGLDPERLPEHVRALGDAIASQVRSALERAAGAADVIERVRAALGIPGGADVAASVEALAERFLLTVRASAQDARAGARAIEELVRVSEVLLGARPAGWEPTPERVAALGGACAGRARELAIPREPGDGDRFDHAHLDRAEAALESIRACIGADPEEDLVAAVAAIVQREVEHEAALREALGLDAGATDAEVLAAVRDIKPDNVVQLAPLREDLAAALAALGVLADGRGALDLAAELRRVLEARRLDQVQQTAATRSPLRVADARHHLASILGALSGAPPRGKFNVDEALCDASERVEGLRRRALSLADLPPFASVDDALSALEHARVAADRGAGWADGQDALAELAGICREVCGAAGDDLSSTRRLLGAGLQSTRRDLAALLSALGRPLAEGDRPGIDSMAQFACGLLDGSMRPTWEVASPRDALSPVAEATLARFADAASMTDAELRDAVARASSSARRDLLDVVALLAGDVTDEDREQGLDGLARAARRLAREALDSGRAAPPMPDDDLRARVEALGSLACAVLDASDPARALDFLNGEISRAARDVETAADALGLEPDPDATLPALASRVRARAQDMVRALRELASSVAPLEPGDDACPDAALARAVPRVAALVGECLGRLSDSSDPDDPPDLVAAAEALLAAAQSAIGGQDAAELRAWAPAAHAVLLRVSVGIADECPSTFSSPRRTTCRSHEPLGEDAARELLAAVETHANWHLALDPILPRGWDLVRLLDDVVLPYALEDREVVTDDYVLREDLCATPFVERLADRVEDQLRGPGASSAPEYWDRRDVQASALRDALDSVLDTI